MTVPEEWLDEQTTFEAVDEELAEGWGDMLCVEEWFAFRRKAEPGDELWSFFGEAESLDFSDARTFLDPPTRWSNGYALVRDGRVVDVILTAWS